MGRSSYQLKRLLMLPLDFTRVKTEKLLLEDTGGLQRQKLKRRGMGGFSCQRVQKANVRRPPSKSPYKCRA
jgi:hypothetical protein